MADINPAAEEVAASSGDQALFVKTDISDWDSQIDLYKRAFEWTTPTFLFANAGITGTESSIFQSLSIASANLPEKPTLETININLLGTLYSIQLFSRHFLAHNHPSTVKASIVVTSSEAGVYSLFLDPVYCATKYALVGLTRSLWPTLSSSGISINAILPGFVPSAITSPLMSITPVERLTPLTTIVNAVAELRDGEQTGQTQRYPNEVARWVWEDAPKIWQEAWEKSQQA